MNEEALEYSFNLFSDNGYNGTIDDYKALISSNQEALDESYRIFSEGGYNGTIDDYSTLLGVGKQTGVAETGAAVTPTGEAPESMELESVNGSSGLFGAMAARMRAADPFNITGTDYEPEPEDDQGGYLITEDQKYEQIPFEQKINLFQKGVNDYFAGVTYYDIPGYDPQPTPEGFTNTSRTQKLYRTWDADAWNSKTGKAGRMVVRPEWYELIETHFPNQFDLFDTEEEYNFALSSSLDKALKDDPVINSTLEAIMKSKSDDLKNYQQELIKKHDVNTPEGLDAAEKDLSDYIRDEIVIPFEKSVLFKEVYDAYAEAGENIFAEKNVSYRRSKDPFLRDDPYAFTEGIVKGWLQMKTGFKQADISQYHGEIGRNMGELNYLYSLSPDTQVVVAQESIMPSSLPRTPMSTVIPAGS